MKLSIFPNQSKIKETQYTIYFLSMMVNVTVVIFYNQIYTINKEILTKINGFLEA